MLQRIRVVMDWAKSSGFRTSNNPVDGLTEVLPRHISQKQQMAAMPYEQVAAFVKMAAEQAVGQTSPTLALEFLILTAARTIEVLGARWEEFDFENRVWTIPKVRMKAAREHRVPLSGRSLKILIEARRLDAGSLQVFPGYRSRKPLSNMAILKRLRQMKVAFTVHGFRSAFRDWASERTNFSRVVCEMALAHTIKSKAEAAYPRHVRTALRA